MSGGDFALAMFDCFVWGALVAALVAKRGGRR